ncbi:uncharacterized protein [Heptranchias perlo]|uniref:uncharacterized protein isoform X2 n=1 Tax=Heptranchias perlo TaxID=212740 RepID=UPI00355A1010
MAAAVKGAKAQGSVATAPRNECLAHKVRPVKPAVANKENCPRPVRPEKVAAMCGSKLPVPVRKLKVKSVPDFKKLHQNWDQNFQKKQTAAKKACTQPVPFNFATSRGAKSTRLVSTDQVDGENTLAISSAVTKKESAISEESYPVDVEYAMVATDQGAVETKPIQNHGCGPAAQQECSDLGPSVATLKLVQSEVVKKENHFGRWQTNATPSKTKSSYVQNLAREIKQPSPQEKAKIERLRHETIKPNTGNSNGDFVGNPMALQSILSNVGINGFNIINGKLSLAQGVSMKKNIQNHGLSNLNPGNNDGMALGDAPSTLDDGNIFGILCGKSSMAMRAPVKDNALHCKYPAQNPYVMGRSSYMPCNRPTFPLAWGRTSCIANLGTKRTEISSPSRVLQPIKLYNQVSSRQHFSSQKSARRKPDGLDFNLMESACETSSRAAPTFVSGRVPCTWKPDAKDREMQTPDRVFRPSNHHFSNARAPSSQNLWHPRRVPAPSSSVVATYKPVKWSDVHSLKGKTDESSASDHAKDGEYLPMDRIVLRLFNDSEDPHEAEKATETPGLKQELETPKSKQGPGLVDVKQGKLKKIELLKQLLQQEMQEVKEIEETLKEGSCDASVPIFAEEHPNLAGAVLKSRPIATALKQQEAEEHVLPSLAAPESHCVALTSSRTPVLVDCSMHTNNVSGAANCLPIVDCQSEMLLPSTEMALNVIDTLPAPVSHSSSRLHITTQGLKSQSPFCSGNRGRGTPLSTSMKQRFGEILPGCRKRFQEALLDKEVSCCLARAIQSPDGRIKRERNCSNPVAKMLEQQEVMHFVPIELPPYITSQKCLQQFLLSVHEEQTSSALWAVQL